MEPLEARLLWSVTGGDETPSDAPATLPELSTWRLDLGGVESAQGVAVQPDGKVLVFGYVGFDPQNSGEQVPDQVALARYNPNGTLDETFGNGGYVIDSVFPDYVSYGSDVVIGPDGSIFVATGRDIGWLLKYSSDGTQRTVIPLIQASQIAMQEDGRIIYAGVGEIGRLNPDGSPDSSFGTGGVTKLSLGADFTIFTDIRIASDGAVFAIGYAMQRATSPDQPVSTGFVVKLNSDGKLAQGFADAGVFKLALTGRRHEQFESMLICSDGGIVAGGNLSRQGLDNGSYMLVRLTALGRLEKAFGHDGVVLDDEARFNHLYDLRELEDGRLVAATYMYGGLSVAVFDADGSFEQMLMGGGVKGMPFWTTNVALADDGVVYAVGHVSIQDANSRPDAMAISDMQVLRLHLPLGPKKHIVPEISIKDPQTPTLEPAPQEPERFLSPDYWTVKPNDLFSSSNVITLAILDDASSEDPLAELM